MELLLTAVFFLVFAAENGDAETKTCSFEAVTKLNTFVDKTLFIKDFYERKGPPLCVTAPHSFGKTTNLFMLKKFFEINVDVEGKPLEKPDKDLALFKNLKIHGETQFFEKHFQKYPVVYLDFAPLRYVGSLEEFTEKLTQIVLRAYLNHTFINYSEKVNETLKDPFNVDPKALPTNFKLSGGSGRRLTEILHTHFGIQCVVLIDEYDALAHAALMRQLDVGSFPEMILDLGDFFDALLHDNRYMLRAFVTGTFHFDFGTPFRTSRLQHVSFTDDINIAKFFGFTDAEVIDLAVKLKSKDHMFNVQTWYDGYIISGSETKLYNPYVVFRFFEKKELDYYWINTDDVKLLAFMMANLEVRELVQDMLVDMTLKTKMFTPIKLNELIELGKKLDKNKLLRDDLIHLAIRVMTQSGYFTISEIKNKTLILRFPNFEVRHQIELSSYHARKDFEDKNKIID